MPGPATVTHPNGAADKATGRRGAGGGGGVPRAHPDPGRPRAPHHPQGRGRGAGLLPGPLGNPCGRRAAHLSMARGLGERR